MKLRPLAFTLLPLLAWLTACSGTPSTPNDAAADSASTVEAGADSSPPVDAPAEAATTEAGTDAAPGPDGAAPDASLDAPADVRPEASTPDAAMPEASTPDARPDAPAAEASSDACNRPTLNTSAIGMSCDPTGAACPMGYTCRAFSGIILTHRCAILCNTDCECPSATTCTMRSDKAGSWRECQ